MLFKGIWVKAQPGLKPACVHEKEVPEKCVISSIPVLSQHNFEGELSTALQLVVHDDHDDESDVVTSTFMERLVHCNQPSETSIQVSKYRMKNLTIILLPTYHALLRIHKNQQFSV